MKNFGKMFLASLTAILVSAFLFSIIPLLIIIGIVSSASKPSVSTVSQNSILVIDHSDIVSDSPNGSPFGNFDLNTLEFKKPVTTLKGVRAILKAANDDNIKAILLTQNGSMQSAGLAITEDIREALKVFKYCDKKVYSYSKVYSHNSYYLSSIADKVLLNPQGFMQWTGLGTQSIFFKGMLDDIGIDVTAIKHGKYKSAIEPFTLSEMSKESRIQNERILSSVWSNILSDISIERGIDVKTLNEYADNLSIVTPKDAYELNMVDSLMYQDQLDDMLLSEFGDDVKEVKLSNYISSFTNIKEIKAPSPQVAVIYIDGQIIDGKSVDGSVGDISLVKQIKKAKDNELIKAVVLRVNSPGGSAMASDVICREVELLQKVKPVIASFGEVSASGGYYLSTLADVIMASKLTITGSIGVFGMHVDASKALSDKLGIDIDIVKTNKSSDMGTPLRAITKAEEGYVQAQVDAIYKAFLDRVSQGRNLTVDRVDAIAQGRVWIGEDAMKVGLIDRFGGLNDAINIAADRADITNDFEINEITKELSPMEAIISMSSVVYAQYLGSNDFLSNKIFSQFERVTDIMGNNKIQAIMPYDIVIE